MTVEQLIKKLQRMPNDAIVMMDNNNMYVNGEYEVKSVKRWDDNTVEIRTDYKHKMYND